jgi:hypothetical protein
MDPQPLLRNAILRINGSVWGEVTYIVPDSWQVAFFPLDMIMSIGMLDKTTCVIDLYALGTSSFEWCDEDARHG